MRVVLATKLIGLVSIALISGSWLPDQSGLAQQTDSPPSLLQQAQTALQEERYADAETLLNKAVENEPNSAEAYYTLGLSLHLQTEVLEAIAAYENAIRIDPKYDLPYINLGLAFIEINQLDKANKVFHDILALPDRNESPASIHTLAHYNLAIISKRQDYRETALTELQAALAITPDFAPAQELLKQLQ